MESVQVNNGEGDDSFDKFETDNESLLILTSANMFMLLNYVRRYLYTNLEGAVFDNFGKLEQFLESIIVKIYAQRK